MLIQGPNVRCVGYKSRNKTNKSSSSSTDCPSLDLTSSLSAPLQGKTVSGLRNWCLLSMVFDCWIVSAILSLNQSGYGFPKPSWTQEPSSNGIVLMAVLQYGGQTAVVQRYFVNSHILHTFIIKWVDFIIVNTKIIFLHNI